ncbi:MAG: metallophosphatase family protein [Lachnospiraceae bacterium]|nr:metallophosphatase family protein [Lachnospiraceae bacterium]
MIYITGDCHRNFERFNTKNFPRQKEMTKDDYVIICGDFGGVWDKDTSGREETWWLNWLENKPFTTLFVDGNHENFDRLYSYPVEKWKGGKVHKVRPSVIHLMRGQVYLIGGKKIFSFCCSSSMQACIGEGMYEPDALTQYFQDLERTVKFKYWFFGHYHDNRNLAGQKILLYEQMIRIA